MRRHTPILHQADGQHGTTDKLEQAMDCGRFGNRSSTAAPYAVLPPSTCHGVTQQVRNRQARLGHGRVGAGNGLGNKHLLPLWGHARRRLHATQEKNILSIPLDR